MLRWLRSLDGYPRAAIVGATLFVVGAPVLATLDGDEMQPWSALMLDALLLLAGGAFTGVTFWWMFVERWRTDHYGEGIPGVGFLLIVVWPVSAIRAAIRLVRSVRSRTKEG